MQHRAAMRNPGFPVPDFTTARPSFHPGCDHYGPVATGSSGREPHSTQEPS